jgi:hypothetical protein
MKRPSANSSHLDTTIELTHNKSIMCQTSLLLPSPHVTRSLVPETLTPGPAGTQAAAVADDEIMSDEDDDDDIIDKSQESLVAVYNTSVAKPQAVLAVEESSTVDSSDIIPASIPMQTPVLRRPIVETSSLSISPTMIGNTGTLASLNESDYNLEMKRPTRGVKKRKVARRLSPSGDKSLTPDEGSKKQRTKSGGDEKAQDEVMQWSYSSQDAVVVDAIAKSKLPDQRYILKL